MTEAPQYGLTRTWRLTSEPYASKQDAFSGEGARRTGRRWNSRGTLVVYASSSIALASLEILVNLEDVQTLQRRYVACAVVIPDELIARLEPASVPADWTSMPHPLSTRAIGDEWVRRGETAVLAVPSAVVPLEPNYLLNPRHPDFGRLEIGDALEYPFDGRLTPYQG